MGFISIFMLVMVALWALWMVALYYHVLKYKIPRDLSIWSFGFFLLVETSLALVFVYYYAGIDWSSL